MGAKRTWCLSKHHHPSKSEADYCNWLLARFQNGEIKSFSLYPSVPLRINGKPWKRWKIDFLVNEKDGTTSYHESKGWNRSDESFRLKRDAFLLVYPTMKLYVNKELYTGQPKKKRLNWTMQVLSARSRKAARSRRLFQANRRAHLSKI